MKICFYSPIKDVELFSRVGFYRDDIAALSLMGDDVLATNSLLEVLKFRPDLMVGYFYSKSIVAAFIGRLVGSKVVLTGGADQISPVLVAGFRLFVFRLFAFIGLLLASRVLLSCRDDVKNFCSLTFGIHFLQSKIQLASHAVIPTCDPKNRTDDKYNGFNAITFCWMGSKGNVVRKGVDKSIRLVSKLCKMNVNASLKIAGTDGPGREFLEDLCEELGVTSNVFFLGPVTEEEKKELFSSNLVYLQLSEYEGFGVAAAEALFSGMTVVHSNKGGLRDVIGSKGIVLNFDFSGDYSDELVGDFYRDFVNFKVDLEAIIENLDQYSIKRRSEALIGNNYVRK